MRKTATCAADASAISPASAIFPRYATIDGAPVLGRVPDDRDDDRRDEELAEAHLLGEHLERADEDLRDERRRDRRDCQDEKRCAQ